MSVATADRVRSAIALAGLGTVSVRRADQRRSVDGERVLREAIVLRKRGFTWKETSPYVGVSPSWLSLSAPPEFRYLPNDEPPNRRGVSAWMQANSAHQRLKSLVGLRRKVDIEREWHRPEATAPRNATELAEASCLIERRARARLRSEWEEALRMARAQERAAELELERGLCAIETNAMLALRADWKRVIGQVRDRQRKAAQDLRREERARHHVRRYQRGWERSNAPRIIRLDAVVEDRWPGNTTERHEMHAALVDPLDPQRHLEGELLDSLVGDLSIADIQRMSDDQLRPLRTKLIEAGFASERSIQRKEQERLRTPMPRRGEGGGGGRTFEAMTTDYKHRKPGHQSSAGGAHKGRKPRRPGRGRHRDKVVY